MNKMLVLLLVSVFAVALVAGCIGGRGGGGDTPPVDDGGAVDDGVVDIPTADDSIDNDYTDIEDTGGVDDEEILGFGLEEEPIF